MTFDATWPVAKASTRPGRMAFREPASGFVTRVDGSYSNVVGLPAAEVVNLLRDHGAIEQWP